MEEEVILEQRYWLRRKREALAMAWKATSARARLIHLDLAGRYSVKAANTAEGTCLSQDSGRPLNHEASIHVFPGALEDNATGPV